MSVTLSHVFMYDAMQYNLEKWEEGSKYTMQLLLKNMVWSVTAPWIHYSVIPYLNPIGGILEIFQKL